MRTARWLAGALALTVLAGCEGRRRAAPSSSEPAREERRSGPTVAVLDLSDGVPDEAPTGLLGLPSKAATLPELIHEIDRIRRDEEVKGVLLRLGTARIGLARAQEIAGLVAPLAAKVPVWCHADDLGNATAYLSARACKRVWLSPAASVDAVGLASQNVYFHELLAQKIGLDVDFLQVGKFKGAEEPFTRDGPSPEARASLEGTLADMRAVWLDGFRTARPSIPEGAPEDGPYSANAAKDHQLVDDVGYFDDARDALEKASGAVRATVRLGAGVATAGGDDLSDVLRAIAGESLGSAPVAVVRANGAISMEGGGLLSEGGGIVERRLVRTLARLEKDDDIKAVVLRIDSPGGSALASDLLWHELMKIRARKPLVVSVGSMAASGGYYLASSGNVVFAEDASIVGSIGVVGGKIAADHALERIGVHAETVPAKVGDPGAAARAAYESLFTPWDDATRAKLLETMEGIYQLFLARVAEGRNIPQEKVAESAEGRIFSGREGKARGLVDEIGGLADALAKAKALAGLDADARVGVIGEGGGLLDALADDSPQGRAPASLARQLGERGFADRLAADLGPELLPFFAAMAELGDRERVLCAVPFAVNVR